MDQPLLNDAILIKREFLNSKSNYSQENKHYRNIMKELIDMGFELQMIDMCFCFFNIKSMEEAITFLTKDEGIWQHNYIESENKLCIICNENSDHINYQIYNTKKIERESLNKRFSRNSLSSSNMHDSIPRKFFEEAESDQLIKFKKIKGVEDEESRLIINTNQFNETITEDKNIISVDEEGKNDSIYVLCKVCELESSLEDCFNLKCKHTFCKECWYFYLDQKISHSEVK